MLERDRRLVGERRERLDLVGVEPARRRRADREQPDGLAASPERRRQADDRRAGCNERQDLVGGVRRSGRATSPRRRRSCPGRRRAAATFRAAVRSLEQEHGDVGREQVARVDDDGVEDLVDVRQRGDRDAHPVQGPCGRAPGLELGVPRAQGARQRVDAAGTRRRPNESARTSTAVATRMVSHGNGSASSEERVAEQLEPRDDGHRDQHEEPAEASAVAGVGPRRAMHQLGRRDGRIGASIVAPRRRARSGMAGAWALASLRGSAAGRPGTSRSGAAAPGPAPSPGRSSRSAGTGARRGRGRSAAGGPSRRPRAGRRSRRSISRRSAASSTSRSRVHGESSRLPQHQVLDLVADPGERPLVEQRLGDRQVVARRVAEPAHRLVDVDRVGEQVRPELRERRVERLGRAARTARPPGRRSRPRPRPAPR